MTSAIPQRTQKGRDVLLDRNIALDTKLRTVLAQCDGKRDVAQIKARFGAILDVEAALAGLLAQGLVEAPPAGTTLASPPVEVPVFSEAVPAAAPVVAAPAAAPTPAAVEPAADDPFSEWFPPSMRTPRGQGRSA